jgi:hypothetical protein
MSQHIAIAAIGKDTVTDIELAIELDHKNIDKSTTLLTHNGYSMVVYGAVVLLDNETDRKHIGENGIDDLARELGLKRDKIIVWANNRSSDEALSKRIEWLSNPWIDWVDEKGEPVCDIFSEVYQDEKQNIALLNEALETIE